MNIVLGGDYHGKKINIDTKLNLLYIRDNREKIYLSKENIEQHELKSRQSSSKTYTIKWKDGGKSVVQLDKSSEPFFVAGCEVGMEGPRNRQIPKPAKILLYSAIIAFLFGVFYIPIENRSKSTKTTDSSSSSVPNPKVYKWASWDGNEEDIPNAKVLIRVLEAVGDNSTGFGHIRGGFYNRLDSKITYAQITFGLYNSSGNKIGNCFTNTSYIGAGEIWQFDAVCTDFNSNGTYKVEDVTYY